VTGNLPWVSPFALRAGETLDNANYQRPERTLQLDVLSDGMLDLTVACKESRQQRPCWILGLTT
jgi:hypothetical protein